MVIDKVGAPHPLLKIRKNDKSKYELPYLRFASLRKLIMKPPSKLWFLENINLYQNLKKEDIQCFEKTMLLRRLRKHEVLRFPRMLNHYVYLLKEGMIKICTTDDKGNEFIK